MRRLTRKQYLALFSPESLTPIEAHLREPGTTAAVCFENSMMDSSEFGSRAHLPVGACWTTIKTLEETEALDGKLGRPLGDAPSRFKYPRYYWRKPVTEEDVQWEALQDEWDRQNPANGLLPRDDEAADEYVNKNLAARVQSSLARGKV